MGPRGKVRRLPAEGLPARCHCAPVGADIQQCRGRPQSDSPRHGTAHPLLAQLQGHPRVAR
eukprot:1587789-Lingulodinium_polyedra.AAC.1